METWVVGELLKARYNRGLAPNTYFWRDRSGHEIDVLVDRGASLAPVEVKSGETVTHEMLAGLAKWPEIAGDAAGPAWLIYGGQTRQARSGCRVLPWRDLGVPGVMEEIASAP